QVVVLFQDPPPGLPALPAGPIPDVPFVPGDVDLARARLAGEHFADDAFGDAGTLIELQGTSEEFVVVVSAISHVGMQRQVIGVMAKVIEDRAVPAGPIGAGIEVGGSGGDK